MQSSVWLSVYTNLKDNDDVLLINQINYWPIIKWLIRLFAKMSTE